MKKKLFLLIAATVLFSLIVFSGCDTRTMELDDIVISSMTVNPNQVEIGDTVTAYVKVIVQDDDGFGVTNTKVLFKSSAGSLDPASTYTDSSGVATVKFDYTTITSAPTGGVLIEAFVNDKDSGITATANLEVGNAAIPEINSLQFDGAPISLQVAGTGGVESSALDVSVYDYQGELITDPMDISFMFANGPADIKINNTLAFTEADAVTVTSEAGIATVSISSGIISGGASIKAFVAGTTISASMSSILVQAGAPHSVEFTMPGDDTGEDMGAGSWKVQISALVNDSYGNPVGDGTSVFFSIEDDISYASLETQFCYVGNENADGDTLAGTAFTFLNYDGTHTNDSFNIRVVVSDIDFPAETITLPLQFASLEVNAVPLYVEWNDTSGSDPYFREIVLHITLVDAQQNRIDNQDILVTGNLGFPVPDTDPDPEDFHGFTGFIDPEHGRLDKSWYFPEYQCPDPSPAGPGTTTCSLTATVFGTNVSNNANIILYKYVEFPE